MSLKPHELFDKFPLLLMMENPIMYLRIKERCLETLKHRQKRKKEGFVPNPPKSPYVRAGIITPEEAFSQMGQTVILHGVKVRLNSWRYRCYMKKGLKCAKCGFTGEYFAVERHKSHETDYYHLNLYGRNRIGHEIMMTVDHIYPKSKGGKNHLSNLQTMCESCNRGKADTVETEREGQ